MGRSTKDSSLERTLKDQRRRGLQCGTKEQINEWFARAIVMPTDEIMRYATDRRAPIVVALTARSLLEKRGFNNLAFILERLFGKPTEHVDHTTAGKSFNVMENLSAEELDNIIANLTERDKERGSDAE